MRRPASRVHSHDFLRMVIVLIVCTMVIAGISFHFFDTDLLDYLPPFSLCFFSAIININCPGCGMTRALLTTGQLNFVKAFQLNPFSLPLLIAMMMFLCHWRRCRPSWVYPNKWPKLTKLMLLGVLIIWLFRLQPFI